MPRCKNFYTSMEINLLEKSEKLKKIQESKIKNEKVKWIKEIDELSYGPIIFFGNEFFDSLPIKQLYKKKKLFLEKHVTLSRNKKKIQFVYKKAQKNLIKNIKKFKSIKNQNIIEYPHVAMNYIKKISRKISVHDGALLTFDYGYYSNKKNKDTLQSVRKHNYFHLLNEPGSADITHHINYKLFIEIFKKNKLETNKIVTQSEFLHKLGIVERATILSKNISFKAKADMFYRLKKLLDYNQMGSLFKVLMAQKKGRKFKLGF